MLFLYKETLLFSACLQPMQFVQLIMQITFFKLQLKFLFIMSVFSKV